MILTLSFRGGSNVRVHYVEREIRALVEADPYRGRLIAKSYIYSENRRGLVWDQFGRGAVLPKFDAEALYRVLGETLAHEAVTDWQVELRTPREPASA